MKIRQFNTNYSHEFSVLIGIQSKIQNKLDAEWIACALLSAMAHDYGHPGTVNHFESDIESETIKKIRPFLSSHKVASFWCDALEHAILNSDFSLVQKIMHQFVAKNLNATKLG